MSAFNHTYVEYFSPPYHQSYPDPEEVVNATYGPYYNLDAAYEKIQNSQRLRVVPRKEEKQNLDSISSGVLPNQRPSQAKGSQSIQPTSAAVYHNNTPASMLAPIMLQPTYPVQADPSVARVTSNPGHFNPPVQAIDGPSGSSHPYNPPYIQTASGLQRAQEVHSTPSMNGFGALSEQHSNSNNFLATFNGMQSGGAFSYPSIGSSYNRQSSASPAPSATSTQASQMSQENSTGGTPVRKPVRWGRYGKHHNEVHLDNELDAIPNVRQAGTGVDLTNRQRLLLLRLPLAEGTARATAVYNSRGDIRPAYGYLTKMSPAFLNSINLTRERIPPTTHDRPNNRDQVSQTMQAEWNRRFLGRAGGDMNS